MSDFLGSLPAEKSDNVIRDLARWLVSDVHLPETRHLLGSIQSEATETLYDGTEIRVERTGSPDYYFVANVPLKEPTTSLEIRFK